MSSRPEALQSFNVAIGGPQGVGKSTVLRVLAMGRPNYVTISVGDQFPPDFRTLSDLDRARVRDEASAYLSARLRANRDRVLMVDLHYLDLREATPRIQTPEILGMFDLHVLLSLSANILVERRTADHSRRDRPVTIIDAERDLAAHLSYFRGETFRNRETLVLDCRETPQHVADGLRRYVDAAMAKSIPQR